MELLLILIVILMLSGNSEAEELGSKLIGGMLIGVALFVGGFVLLLGFAFYPLATKIVLAIAGIAVVLLIIRGIYRRFFSPKARLQAAYYAMHKRWMKLSEHVVAMEFLLRRTDIPDWEAERLLQKGPDILRRCKEEYERYKAAPPEERMDKFYPTSIVDLEQRMSAAREAITARLGQNHT